MYTKNELTQLSDLLYHMDPTDDLLFYLMTFMELPEKEEQDIENIVNYKYKCDVNTLQKIVNNFNFQKEIDDVNDFREFDNLVKKYVSDYFKEFLNNISLSVIIKKYVK